MDGSYIRRFANAPSAGNTEVLVSGGVLTGVMVSAPLSGALGGGATREAAVVFIVSYEGLAERGLGSLPGGDESELVKGVRAWMDVGWPRRDMMEGVGAEVEGEVEVEAAHAGAEVLESMQFSSVSERRASLL
jgi:hypothetical protein